MKNGKIPMKRDDDYVSFSEAFGGGELELEPEIKAELAKKGLGWKWINGDKVKKNNGRHPKGWKVYTRDNVEKKVAGYGETVDGTIRRGDLVLGVKPLVGEGSIELHRRALKSDIRSQDMTSLQKVKQFEENIRGKRFDGDDDQE
jgi:hypothetical protein